MKARILIVLFFFITYSSYAQLVIEKEIISPFALMSEGALRMESTLGEVIIFSYENEQLIINQGFHAGEKSGSTPVIDINSIQIDVQVFPNPTTDLLNITYDNAEDHIRGFSICDSQGKRVQTLSSLSENKSTISLNNLPNGLYGVVLHSDFGMRFVTWVSLSK